MVGNNSPTVAVIVFLIMPYYVRESSFGDSKSSISCGNPTFFKGENVWTVDPMGPTKGQYQVHTACYSNSP